MAIHESIQKDLLSIEEQKLLCGCGIWTHAHDRYFKKGRSHVDSSNRTIYVGVLCHHMCPIYCIVACVFIDLFVVSAGDLSRAFLKRPAPRIKVITVECSISRFI